MKIQLLPPPTRTLVPIRVLVSGEAELSSLRVVVTPMQGGSASAFTIPMKAASLSSGEERFLEGTFWLEQEGDYEISATSHQVDRVTERFRVREQSFLSFPVEFGIFMVSLIVVGMGLILWQRRKQA